MLRITFFYVAFTLVALGQVFAQSEAAKFEWFVGGGANYLNLGSHGGSIPPVPVKPSLPDTTFVLPKHSSGIGHSLRASTGLVVGLGDSPVTREAFPRLELVAETGLSFLTSGSAPSQSVTVPLPNGQAQNAVLTTRSSFSKTGRVLAGVRFRMTEKNALEFSWSYSPNRYELRGTVNPPVATLVPGQVTQWLNQGALSYVRYLPSPGRVQPFITVGIGLSWFAGIDTDVTRFSGNFGAGLDVPLHKRIALRFEFRDFVSAQPCPVRGVTHNLAPTAGLVFKFY